MIGQTIAQYKITEKIGQGGMGEVFLAIDTKLDRKVALKFLPEHMALIGEVKARFTREAKAASAMNHPNVCTIHDISDHEGRMFIVMEYIDGQTLRDKRDNLSTPQIVEIGAQTAEGLAAAHAQGIVHRDIKSENIMIRKDGIVQIMDFGLAKLRGVTGLTKVGSTLGTAGYMSPEQALGQEVDHRTDLFSLGSVLYELLTGELPFKGEHDAALMYEIVNVDPAPPSTVKADIEPELDRIIMECLQKEPDERYQSAKEIAKDLRRYKRDSGRQRVSRISASRTAIVPAPRADTISHVTVAAQPVVSKKSAAPWIATGIATVAALAFAFMLFTGGTSDRTVIRSHILPPDGSEFVTESGGHLALSPDGSQLAFVATDTISGDVMLWVRRLNSLIALQLPGTKDAYFPFWSPDNKYIAFFAGNKLKKIQATGGPTLTICDASAGREGSWNTDNIILFTPNFVGPAFKVSAAGGEAVAVTILDTTFADYTHRWTRFLPDGNHFLFFARTTGGGGSEKDAICVTSIDGGPIKRLVHTKSNAEYAAGHIIYMRDGTLMAHPFDADALELTGDAFPLVENVSYERGWSRGIFSTSQHGHLVYQTGAIVSGSQLLTYDRAGTVLDSVGEKLTYYDMAYSPDEQKLAVDINDETIDNIDVWIYDLNRDIRTRFTFDAAYDFAPEWSPDGSHIAFVSERTGNPGIYIKETGGAGQPVMIWEGEYNSVDVALTDWSDDGRFLVFRVVDPKTIADIWILPLFGDSTARPILDTEFDEEWGTVSPNGKWLAYMSTESGQEEVYVTTFPEPSGKWQVSTNEGDRPRWRADGKELFYLDNRDWIVSAEVDGTGSSFRVGKVEVLFQTNPQRPGWIYEVTDDGQRFVINTSLTQKQSSPVALITNWDVELPD